VEFTLLKSRGHTAQK